MKTLKVNIWQVGFMSIDDWKANDKSKAVCRPMGYVEVEDADGWEDDVWNLLNWSCWNYDENGDTIKPECVHSPLTHCNSDVILQAEGTQVYRCAKSIGWGTHRTLEYAIRATKTDYHGLWTFSNATK